MKTRFCSAIQPQLLMMMAAKLSMRFFSTSQNRDTLAVPATFRNDLEMRLAKAQFRSKKDVHYTLPSTG